MRICADCEGDPVAADGSICSTCDGACMVRMVEPHCSVMEPCYRPDCPWCAPVGSLPSNMRFALNALSHIYKAKRRAYTGCEPYQTFPRDPRDPTT